jgi:hypothetical protein
LKIELLATTLNLKTVIAQESNLNPKIMGITTMSAALAGK